MRIAHYSTRTPVISSCYPEPSSCVFHRLKSQRIFYVWPLLLLDPALNVDVPFANAVCDNLSFDMSSRAVSVCHNISKILNGQIWVIIPIETNFISFWNKHRCTNVLFRIYNSLWPYWSVWCTANCFIQIIRKI